MEREDIIGQELLSFDVAVDGSRIRMSFSRPDGSLTALNLPSDCLQAMVMTLPKMMAEVLRARHKDDSLRLVYPAHMVRIEQASDPSTLILTLATPDGFEVSFALGGRHLKTLAAAHASLERRPEGAAVAFN
ncbi:hypothetical protein V5F59_04715 [Xanthobacter autotrophicus DSM 431]|uniref:hypothetical protein n=1 Tax=Xanthobacter nonsaccharivorans TaxID=3119912 RepID=UPI003727A2D2